MGLQRQMALDYQAVVVAPEKVNTIGWDFSTFKLESPASFSFFGMFLTINVKAEIYHKK